MAWAVVDGSEFAEFCTDEEEAKGAAKYYGGCTIVPLYRHSQPVLTDAERYAIAWLMTYAEHRCGVVPPEPIVSLLKRAT